MRKAVVAGYFYPDNKRDLIKEIEEKFSNKKFGPGSVSKERDVIGLIVPHAGYAYSGYVAAHAYARISSKKTFVIIGPNHTGFGGSVSVAPHDYWETPLGKVKVNLEFAKSIVKNSEYATLDELAHMQEHSIEVQLPFLQYLFDNKFSIVSICLLDQRKEVAKDLAKAILAVKKDFILIASSDFTHYESQEMVEKKDAMLIEAIKTLDLEEFYRVLRYYNISACGYGAIAVLMEVTRLLRGKIKLVKHMTSGDVTGDYSAVVGYTAMVSKK